MEKGVRWLTSVPWAGKSTRLGQDSLNQWRTVVGAFRANGLDSAGSIQQKHLGAFDALYFHLLFIAWLEGEGRHPLELVFLSHDSHG
jgi:hypothetical protein